MAVVINNCKTESSMKKAINHLFAAIVILAAASCQKETLVEPAVDATCSYRTITGSFDDSVLTKTAIDGTTPRWTDGDAIMITDGMVGNLLRIDLVSSDPQEGQALISDSGSKFTASIPADWGQTLFAVYPASAYVGLVAGSIQFRIPFNQDGSFANANICVARTSDNSISFKNAVAVVKLSEVGEGVGYVSISTPNIGGVYEVETPGDVPTLVSGTGIRRVQINTSGSEYYAAVAPVSVPAGTWVLFEDSDNTIVGAKQTSRENNLSVGHLYDLGAVAKNESIPDGMLRHAFTIGDNGMKCHFSKGNLVAVYNGSSYDFKFADKQYSYIGAKSGNMSIMKGNVAVGDELDYFGWVGKSGSLDAYGITDDETPANYGETWGEPLKKDWGEGFGPASPWSSFNDLEWSTVVSYRETETKGLKSNAHFSRIKVGDYFGMLIYPDKFEWTSAMGTAPNNLDDLTKTWNTVSTYTLDEFKAIEEGGCVFYVAAGFRHPNNKTVDAVNSKAYYWLGSSVTNSAKARHFMAVSNSTTLLRSADRRNFYCVRLVAK